MQEALNRLEALQNEIENISPAGWSQVRIWGDKALPTIVKHCSEHADEFKELLKEPRYPAMPRFVMGRPDLSDSRYIFSPERYTTDMAKWKENQRQSKRQDEREAAAHRQNCITQHKRISAFLNGIIHEVNNSNNASAIPASIDGFVDLQRIDELRSISNSRFDLSKLIRMCEELNICSSGSVHFATLMLVRAIIDHVPPIFGCGTFSEVANNYNGGKSFKTAMRRLNDSARNFADGYLHSHVRRTESLPNRTQVKFDSELDALLCEICRLLKSTETK